MKENSESGQVEPDVCNNNLAAYIKNATRYVNLRPKPSFLQKQFDAIFYREEEELYECSYYNWYEKFEKISIPSKCIKMPAELLKYLKNDRIVLPKECLSVCKCDVENVNTSNCDVHAFANYFDNKDEENKKTTNKSDQDDLIIPEFSEFSKEIASVIEELGGSAFIKTNWHAPQDVMWITVSRTLKVVDIIDVYQLLKASSIVQSDVTLDFSGMNFGDDDFEEFVDTKKSKKVDTKESKEVNTKESKEVDTKKSKKVDTKESKEVNTKESKEVDTKESKEVDTKESKEVDTKESKEVDTKESKEVDTKESKEVDTKESKEVDTKESKEVDTKESKEVDTKESKEADTKESKEADTKESKEADTKESKEVDTKESKEVDTKESKEVDTERTAAEGKTLSARDLDKDIDEAEEEDDADAGAGASATSVMSLPQTGKIEHYLTIKKWIDIDHTNEFRCFVKNRSLFAISPRDCQNYHSHIVKDLDDIIGEIISMFKEQIKHKFNLNSFVFDVARIGKDKIYLIDFHPFNSKYTAALLFTWNELLDWKIKDEDDPEIRFPPQNDFCFIQPNRHTYGNFYMPLEVQNFFEITESSLETEEFLREFEREDREFWNPRN